MKKFIIKISYTVLPIWLFFTIITIYYAKSVKPEISGDLGILSKRAFGIEYYLRLQDTISEKVLFTPIATVGDADTSRCDVLTIGDSFSDMKRHGFQNYMCQYSNLKLYHIASLEENPLASAYYLLDHGLIDSSKVKYLVVESVERSFQNRVLWFEAIYPSLNYKSPAQVDTNNLTIIPVNHTETDKKTNKKNTNTTSESDLSILEAKNWLMLRLGFSKSVYRCKLNRSLFTHDNYDKSLFIYKDDLRKPQIREKDKETVKSVLDKLFDKAKARGINLIILIAADKYDVYQPFIVNNKYAQKTINEDLARIYPSPNIIITKFILQPHLFNGEKDLYLVNDSHWSYKASQIVAHEILERMKDIEQMSQSKDTLLIY